MSNLENHTQPPSSSSKPNIHNGRVVDLSEDKQLKLAIKMSEKEEMFRVEIYSCERLKFFNQTYTIYILLLF